MQLKELDLKSLLMTSYLKNLNDMAATLAKVKATKPDVLVVSGHTKGA